MKINKHKYELAAAKACMGSKDLIAAGIPQGTLSGLSGGKELRPRTVGRIAKALGCAVEDLIETGER